ncbi:MAG: ABC transporter ATP-binding protein [Pseudobacter sp.]|uniref:ABC transporter ATP-binding protein n=1 Tax=Pseudobacter sp. TaxID=2045420 RepID=UPI003F809FD0
MSESIVKVEQLSHRYSVQWAIKDISFELMEKGIYGLLGANGAGKSTIMNIMCGVLKQTKGNVYIRGYNLDTHPVEAKKRIGFLPQVPPVQPELTVEEYLTYCAHLRMIPKSEIPAAVKYVMEQCNLSHYRKRLIKNLSGGYKQRAGIAQAIIHKPEFVIFDEPTNGLDPNQILEVRKLIKSIAEERTVILSTHILQEVQALCEHIWMINEGQMIFSGPMEDFDTYLQPSSLSVSLAQLPSLQYLTAIDGVVEASHTGGIDYTVNYASDSREVISRIVKSAVENNWELLHISQNKNSLDNIFAELSRKKS